MRANSEMLAHPSFAARCCKEQPMSLEQIKREFPFLRQAFLNGYFLWPDGTVDTRVARISLEAFSLPIGEIRESDYVICRQIFVTDAQGDQVFADGDSDGEIYGTEVSGIIGDALLRNFLLPAGRDWAQEVCYIVYTVNVERAKWRRKKGEKKSHQEWKTQRFESVIFKMPKRKTLWQLLQIYLREKRACLRR